MTRSPLQSLAVLLTLGFLAGSVSAQEAPAPADKTPAGVRPLVHIGLSSAAAAAARDGAMILLVFESGNCPACQKFDKETIASPLFSETGGPLHVVYFDLDSAPKTAAQYQVAAVPDLVLMTSQMKILARTQGALPPEELLKWIERGRQRLARGTWEGIAIDEQPGQPVTPASPEDYKKLIQTLGDVSSDSAQRAAAILEVQTDSAVPYLIDGLDDTWLGVRIGSSEILRKLAPSAPAVDPWDITPARHDRVTALRQWWKDTATLPPVSLPELTPEEARSADDAVEGVLAQDALRRTRAMTTLVRLGRPGLPRLRDAIRRCTDTGDIQTLSLFEDVRWAVLIPYRLELAVNARAVLARGATAERQAAALRLGAQGQPALDALRELVDDPDTLVRESTVHALEKIRVPEALDATALLLKATDSNLRTVAAQALGNSKNPSAARYLVTAVNDPDEVVACAAIAALEQIQAKDRATVLISCLTDKRWRVRAAAAEALGKLNLSSANPELKKLVDDPDPFVVKSALTALRQTKGLPDVDVLHDLVKRSPELTGLVVNCLADTSTSNAVKTISAIYDEADEAKRRDVLDALIQGRGGYGSSEPGTQWKPFLAKAAESKDPAIRLKLVAVLEQHSSTTASEFLSRLLNDEDPDVRVAAAGLVLPIVACQMGVYGYDSMPDYAVLKTLPKEDLAPPAPDTTKAAPSLRQALSRAFSGDTDEKAVSPEQKLKRARELLALHRQWHESLKTTLEKRNDLPVVLAFYITGDGKTDLDVLSSILDRKDLQQEISKIRHGYMSASNCLAAVLKRLPWPEGQSFVERFSQSPVRFSMLVAASEHASNEVREFLTQPDRVVAALENTPPGELSSVASVLMQTDEKTFSLYKPTPANSETLRRLVASSSAPARAVGVYVIGHRTPVSIPFRAVSGSGPLVITPPETSPDDPDLVVLGKALADENPWVRYAAVQGVMTRVPDQLKREELLAPLLADKHPAVAAMTALAILDEPLRSPEAFSRHVYFRFEDQLIWAYRYRESSQAPLPPAIDRKPAFLEIVRKRLAEAPSGPVASEDDDRNELPLDQTLTLLLAQYGDYTGLDQALDAWTRSGKNSPSETLLMGLALTRDPRYIAPLKSVIDKETDSNHLRSALRWLEGIKGPEARELRRAINRRIQSEND